MCSSADLVCSTLTRFPLLVDSCSGLQTVWRGGGVSNVNIDGNNALQIKGYRSRHLHVCYPTRGLYAVA